MEPGKDDADSHHVRKNESRVEAHGGDVVKEHLPPVVVSVVDRNHEVAQEVLTVVPVGEQDVAVGARGSLWEQSHKAVSNRGFWVLTTKEVWQPQAVFDSDPAPVRAEEEVPEASEVPLCLADLLFVSIVVAFVYNEVPPERVKDTVCEFAEDTERDATHGCHP